MIEQASVFCAPWLITLLGATIAMHNVKQGNHGVYTMEQRTVVCISHRV
jgi:hypothetical protein